jgi:hypothetical protein
LALEARDIEPHIPLSNPVADLAKNQKKNRLSRIRARRRMSKRMKTKAYALSQRCRKKVEERFGGLKGSAVCGEVDWLDGGNSSSCWSSRPRPSI